VWWNAVCCCAGEYHCEIMLFGVGDLNRWFELNVEKKDCVGVDI
jgi:hypothetical protein